MPKQFHLTEPQCDGIWFDDLRMCQLTVNQVNFLAMRGVVWMTNLTEDSNEHRTYTGHIIAADLAGATEIAFGRGLGETVIAQLESIVPVKDGTEFF